jgi:hypothetical protein
MAGRRGRTWMRRDESQWRALLSRFSGSGLSAAALCERESVSTLIGGLGRKCTARAMGCMPSVEVQRDVVGYRTGIIWEEGLRASAAQASDMTLSTVDVVDRSSAPTTVKAGGKEGVSRPLVFVELNHFLSQDLDKLRMQARARLFDEKGTTKFDTYFFFLPPSVPGATKKDAIESWSQDRGERYRRSSQLGVRAIFDALHLTVMSHGQSAAQGVKDAGEVLSRRSCYAGDFEVGIPLKAYDGGSIIAAREDYWIIRLVNNEVLIISACER